MNLQPRKRTINLDELEKEIESLRTDVAVLDANQATVERNQARFQDASQILIGLARKARRRAAEHQGRLAKLEEQGQSFVGFAQATDVRLDSIEESAVHTDARVDALIDSQIRTEQQLANPGGARRRAGDPDPGIVFAIGKFSRRDGAAGGSAG